MSIFFRIADILIQVVLGILVGVAACVALVIMLDVIVGCHTQ